MTARCCKCGNPATCALRDPDTGQVTYYCTPCLIETSGRAATPDAGRSDAGGVTASGSPSAFVAPDGPGPTARPGPPRRPALGWPVFIDNDVRVATPPRR